MGNATAKAREEAQEEKERVNALIQTLENKLDALELEIETKRGLDNDNKLEVAGGRSVLRIKEVRVSDGSGLDKEITEGIENFFRAAQNGLDDEEDAAKKSAVDGAKNLVSAGLSALFGVSNGQGLTRRSFVVLFLNNSFVRVDYFIYSYSVDAKIWGAEANQSGTCYIADLSVLKLDSLEPEEIDFLLSQALSISNAEFAQLNQLKIALIQSAILSRALKKEDLTFEEVAKIAESLAESQEKISEAFNKFTDYIPLAKREEQKCADLKETITCANKTQMVDSHLVGEEVDQMTQESV